jgi:predicted ATP-grasp superfamily ATP-dependent carboligase
VGDFADQIKIIPHELAIPVGSSSVEQLVECQHPLAALPPKRAFEIAMSKEETTFLANKLKVPTPKTFSPISMDDLDDILMPFPWVVKGVLEAGKNVINYANTLDEARKAFFTAQNDVTQHDRPPIVQEFVNGKGVGFFAFYQNGVLKRYYIHRRIRETPYTGGSSTAAETIDHPKAFEYGKTLLDALKWHGPAMVEFKEIPETGDLRLLEINPKLWGSLELGLAAGVNFGDLLLRTIRGEDLAYSDKYEKVQFYWPFEGDLISIFRSGLWENYDDYFKKDYLSDAETNGFGLNLLNFFRYMR